MTIEPSTRFSSGTEYEIFLYNFCQRCSKGKIREDDGFPELPENGGCPIWDAMEYARFGEPFPSEKIVRLVDKNGKTKVWNCCTEFQTDDENLMAAYKALFEEV